MERRRAWRNNQRCGRDEDVKGRTEENVGKDRRQKRRKEKADEKSGTGDEEKMRREVRRKKQVMREVK